MVGEGGEAFISKPDGTIIGPSGREVAGLKIPRGGKLVVGIDGRPYVQRPDGTILGPDGQVITDYDGEPLRVRPGEIFLAGADGVRLEGQARSRFHLAGGGLRAGP